VGARQFSRRKEGGGREGTHKSVDLSEARE
jgi:hypothetical protein